MPELDEFWSRWEMWSGGTIVDRVTGKVLCRNGHECQVSFPEYPVGGSRRFCKTCRGFRQNVFYVVANQPYRLVKIGITTGDPRPRLGHHRMNGFTSLYCLLTDLPEAIAEDIEQYCLTVLAENEFRPIHGREYFKSETIETLIDALNSYSRLDLNSWINYPICSKYCKAGEGWGGPCRNPCTPAGYTFDDTPWPSDDLRGRRPTWLNP